MPATTTLGYFLKSIAGLAALVYFDIKVTVFDHLLFVFLNKSRNCVRILY
ncbi:IS66 family insertion sequence element accessory protein TnpB [Pseudomonas sp. D47]